MPIVTDATSLIRLPQPLKPNGLGSIDQTVVNPFRTGLNLPQIDPREVTLEPASRLRVNGSNKAPERFLDEVIFPASNGLPEGVSVVSGDYRGNPVLLLNHSAEYRGNNFDLSYLFLFQPELEEQPLDFIYPSIKDTNIVPVPSNWNSPEALREVQNAYRRITIADPMLNKRLREKGVITFEDFQLCAIEAGVAGLKSKKNAFLHMATGTGKTLIAFAVADRFLTETGRTDEAIIYMVDNTVGLREAEEEKLKALFGNKYSSSKAYGKNPDFSGRIIFTTPSTLSQKEHMLWLLRNRKVGLIVFDELHHIAATEYRVIKRFFEERSPQTAFLGLTATINRRDKANVVKHIGGSIDYAYPLLKGWEEGHLVLPKIVKGYLDMNPKDTIVKPYTDLAARCSESRYSPARDKHIFQVWHETTKGDINRQTLITLPNIPTAQRLSGYFNNPIHFPGQGVKSSVLTYIERGNDEEEFFRIYDEWKRQLTKDSPLVVATVRICNESTDIPDVRNVLLLTVTTSGLALMQQTGRAYRPSPFKTHVNLIDAGGVLRTPENIRLLASNGVFLLDDSQSNGSAANIATRASLLGLLTGFGEELPVQLARDRFTYMELDLADRVSLDDYMVKRCNFSSRAELYDYINEHSKGSLLEAGNKVDIIKNFRDRRRPAFHAAGVYEPIDGEEIPLEPSTYLVFHRINDLMDPEGQTNIIYTYFPEFDSEKAKWITNAGINLVSLRRMIFPGVSRERMVRELAQEVINKGRIKRTHNPAAVDFILSNYELVLSGASPVGVEIAEGGINAARELENQTGEGHVLSPKYATFGHKRQQRLLAEAYFAHPGLAEVAIAGELTFEDLERRPRADFNNHLVTLGLVKIPESDSFCRAVAEYASRYKSCVTKQKKIQLSIDGARKDFLGFLRKSQQASAILPLSLTEGDIHRLHKAWDDLNASLNLLGEKQTKEDGEIRSLLNTVLFDLRVRCVINTPELKDIVLIMQRRKPTDFEVSLYSDSVQYRNCETLPPFRIVCVQDASQRPNVLLAKDYTPRGKNPKRSNLQELYKSLGRNRGKLVEVIVSGLSLFKGLSEKSPLFLVPYDKDPEVHLQREVTSTPTRDGLYRGIADHILTSEETGDWDIIYPVKISRAAHTVKRCKPNSTEKITSSIVTVDLNYILQEAAEESRVSFLNSEGLKELTEKAHPRAKDLKNKAANIQLTLHDYRNLILINWQRLREMIAIYEPPQKEKEMLEELNSDIGRRLKDSWLKHPQILEGVKASINNLLIGTPPGELTDEKVHYAYLRKKFDDARARAKANEVSLEATPLEVLLNRLYMLRKTLSTNSSACSEPIQRIYPIVARLIKNAALELTSGSISPEADTNATRIIGLLDKLPR